MKDDQKNPVDCSLFYLALKKKNVLLGIWKLANSHPEQAAMLKFLANDFKEEKWRNAALKNAYALLGKQRFGILSFNFAILFCRIRCRFLSPWRAPQGCRERVLKAYERLPAGFDSLSRLGG